MSEPASYAPAPTAGRRSDLQRGPDLHLRTEHLRTNLRARSVRGAVIALATRAVSATINFASLAILARLLVKEDFGIVFTVTAITNILGNAGNFGLGTATLQRRDLTDSQVSTLLWINVTLAAAVGAVTMALAPAIVWIYGGDSRVFLVAMTYGVVEAIGGFEVQHRALLLRQMQFLRIAMIDVVALTVSALPAIVAAWYGAGYWALVLQAVIAATAKSAGAWLGCSWRPGRPGPLAAVRPLLSFGGNLTASHFVFDAARNTDKILLGRFVGHAATGIYGNAFRLLLLPANHIDRPITNVAVGALSRLQDEPARFRGYYRKAILLLASVTIPFAVFVFVAADPVVLAALGAHWHDAVPILRILAPAALVETLGSTTSWVYSATGRTDRQARWTTFASLMRLLAVCIGVAWGAVGVATATSLATVGLRYWGIAYCFRESPLQLRDLGSALWRPAAAAVVAGACLFASGVSGLPPGSAVLAVLAGLLIFTAAYVAAWVALPGGRGALREMTALARDLRPARRTEPGLHPTAGAATPLGDPVP